ncbi:MAG TPA: RES family NAD+ phosphorylase [Gaiellaceae bacterium]
MPADACEPIDDVVRAFRLDWHEDPLALRRYPKGKFRFDAPRGEFSVIYLCSDDVGCFAEVFGDTRYIDVPDGKRRLFAIASSRPLRLLDLMDGSCLMTFDLDARICTMKPYRRPQLWSRAFHEWYPKLDGLRYVPRHATGKTNYCLYLDRCATDLRPDDRGPIERDVDLLERAVDAYPLTTPLLV